MSKVPDRAAKPGATGTAVTAASSASGLRKQRDLAKKSMLVSLGVATVTGVMLMRQSQRRGRTTGVAAAHIAAGLAMVGTSWWHHVLYPPAKK